jgi:hypothetical protein
VVQTAATTEEAVMAGMALGRELRNDGEDGRKATPA